ncbi:MAG: YbaK/EbsC family protein [Actinobacteria bacterium]|nr:MAG: YbaK/EbsC family protein [Actinomycetota bacterium]
MVSVWPEPVEHVASFLREAGAEARIEEFAEGTPTAADAAAAVGCGLDQIVKSLVKVAQAVGASEARIAKADEVEDATGFTPGAVAPFPLPKVETIYLDRLLLGHPIVWAGAGSENHLVGLAPTELARLARAQTMDVVQADPYHFRGRIGGDEAEPKER